MKVLALGVFGLVYLGLLEEKVGKWQKLLSEKQKKVRKLEGAFEYYGLFSHFCRIWRLRSGKGRVGGRKMKMEMEMEN